MADLLKVLGQAAPAATTLTALYTVPTGRTATLSSICVCNRGVATSFRVSVAVAGAADATKQYLYYDVAIPAADSFMASIGITLSAGDVVRVYGGHANLSFSAFGVEVY